ncbi:hypothetical protein D3C84_1026980 [compost metagenome]
MEKYALSKEPISSFDKKVIKQLSDDLIKGNPSQEKIIKRENRYFKSEIMKRGKHVDELIIEAKERFEKSQPPQASGQPRGSVHIPNSQASSDAEARTISNRVPPITVTPPPDKNTLIRENT